MDRLNDFWPIRVDRIEGGAIPFDAALKRYNSDE